MPPNRLQHYWSMHILPRWELVKPILILVKRSSILVHPKVHCFYGISDLLLMVRRPATSMSTKFKFWLILQIVMPWLVLWRNYTSYPELWTKFSPRCSPGHWHIDKKFPNLFLDIFTKLWLSSGQGAPDPITRLSSSIIHHYHANSHNHQNPCNRDHHCCDEEMRVLHGESNCSVGTTSLPISGIRFGVEHLFMGHFLLLQMCK